MARYTYVVLSTGTAGQEDAFRSWYKDQHLGDVARMPEIISARLLFPDIQLSDGLGVPKFSAMAIYELESEDAKASIDAMFAKAGTHEMPMTADMDMAGLFQFVGHEVHSIG